MILSMTGFGKAETDFGNRNVTVEIRSLNSKQADIYTRIPNDYKDKDLEIRNYLKEELMRGKIDFSLNITMAGEAGVKVLDTEIAKKYYQQLANLSAEIGLDMTSENVLETLVRMPEVLTTKEEEITEAEWNELWQVIGEAVRNLKRFRKQEGESLQEDLLANVTKIESLLEEVLEYETERIETVKQRLQEQLDSLNVEANKERFEQELIYYLEKLDINEEKVRLIVVQMKEALEQIKEQVLNVL